MLFGQRLAIGHFSGIRSFSSSSVSNRLYAHVVRRKLPKDQTVPLKQGDPAYLAPNSSPEFPLYPYGESNVYKQSNRGLYGGKVIQFGHKISEFKNRNNRTFKPNVNQQTLWSETLGRKVTLKVATSVVRTITKEGGLDNYLIQDTASRIKELGPLGWKLRYLVLRKLEDRHTSAPNPVELSTDSNAATTKIYAKYTDKNGIQFNITSGRNKVLQELYQALKKEGMISEMKKFTTLYRPLPLLELLKNLEELHYDFSKVSQTA